MSIILRYLFLALCLAFFTFFPCTAPAEETATSNPANKVTIAGTTILPDKDDRVVIPGVEPLLVGLYVNSRLQKEDTIYREKNEYWVPFALFLETTGLKEDGRTESTARYTTSLGVISFNTSSLKTFNSVTCISFSDLRTVFLAMPEFNQPLFAVMMNIPWNPGASGKRQADVPDINAPGSSISFIGLEAQGTYDFNSISNKNLLIASGGRALGGIWNINVDGDPETKMTLSRYNWTTYNRHTAIRLGTSYSESYSLIGSINMTGVQFGWNNRSIIKQLDAEQSYSSDTFLSLDTTQLRTLEGSGPPGSIAELRFDTEVVARQRIKLDGKFIFENVRMSTDLRKTEVYIYERSINEKPIKVINFSQSISTRTLPKGELLVRGGVGKTGNLLDGQAGLIRNTEAFGNIIYGLDKRVTLEAAMQRNTVTETPDILAGTVISAGNSWTTALYGARSNGSYGADLRLEGHYKHWNTAYWGTIHNKNFGMDTKEKYLSHSFRFSANPFQQLGLQAIGRYEKQGDSLMQRYILPAVNWYPASWLSFSATPTDANNYHYESGIRIGDHNTFRTTYDKEIVSVDYLRDINEYLNLRLLDSYSIDTRNHITNLAVDWYPRKNSNDLLSTAISYSSGSFGISGSWSRYVNTGLRIAMQYSYNMNNAANLNTNTIIPPVTPAEAQKSIGLTLSWDLGWSNRGFFPVNRSALTLTRGAIAGSLDIANSTKLSSSDINNISIMLNGRQMQQRQIDGSFFIGSLPPGIYRVSVDPDKLPIELVVNQKEIKVEVKSGAVTGLNIPVYAEFGVSGQVTDLNGSGLTNVIVMVTDKENKTVLQTFTNEFGFYRADGLRSGTYSVTIASIDSKPVDNPPKLAFTITDNYLFDLNLKANTGGISPSATTP